MALIYILDRTERVVGVLSNDAPLACPYFDDLHVENIETGVHTYEFSVPASHETAEAIEIDGYVIIRDLDNKMQMFKIKDITEEVDDTKYDKKVYCEHIAIPELLGNVVRPAKLSSYTIENAMLYVLDDTGWTLGNVEYSESKDIEFEDYITTLEAIYTIIEAFEAELQFEVIFENGEVTKRLIHVIQRRGIDTKKWFIYGKDLIDVKRSENSEGLVTALIGVGKGNPDGSRLTLANFTPSGLKAGFEKPYEADWVGNEEALQRYGKNGKHIFGIFFDEHGTNKQELFEHTQKELEMRCRPKLTYEMKVATLERITGYEADKVRIGDTILAKDTSMKPVMVVEARVLELKRSYTNPENDEVVLGDYRPIRISNYTNIQKIQNIISANEAKWEASNYKVEIISSNGLAFKHGDIYTVLEARVYRNGVDVTDEIDANCFRWTRVSNDPEADEIWNMQHSGGTKTIVITSEDVKVRATFNCSIDVNP
jgi:phage minor structural protein